MSKADPGKKSSNRKFTFLALIVLALCGLSLNEKSNLRERGARAAQNPKVIQGQPIQSAPDISDVEKPQLPEGADLTAMSQSAPDPKAKDGFISLTLDQLSQYEYPLNRDGTIRPLDDGSLPSIPSKIKELDQKKVVISGYMMPLDFEQSKVSYFILNRNQLMCCYGQEPKINEYCLVIMSKPAEVYMDLPVTVSGTLLVGELMEDDTVLCIYRLSGETVEPMD